MHPKSWVLEAACRAEVGGAGGLHGRKSLTGFPPSEISYAHCVQLPYHLIEKKRQEWGFHLFAHPKCIQTYFLEAQRTKKRDLALD